MSSSSRGANRERQLQERLRAEGWTVYRAAGSHGHADLVALKAGEQPMLIQVKATMAGPFHSFSPSDRLELAAEADRAGATAILAWWPYDRKPPRFIDQRLWPNLAMPHPAKPDRNHALP